MSEPVEILVQPRAVRDDGSVPFVAPQRGVDPTEDEHLATKAYVDGAPGGGVTAHAALTGLSADDHPQYVLANGTRAFSAVVAGVDPTLNAHLATKGYTDFAISTSATSIAVAAAATFQPLNAVLSNLSTFTTSVTGNVPYFLNTIGGLTSAASTSFGRGLWNLADAAAARSAIGSVIGTDVQAYSAKLAAIASLTWANDKGVVLTGTGTLATFDLTSAARTVLAGTTVAAMVDTLGGAASTGSGGLVRATSPTLVTPALGTPSSGTLTNCTGLPVAGGGTGRATSTTAYGLIAAGTTATGAHQTLPAGATTDILVGGGASALPVWTASTGSGKPVRQTSPSLVTPDIGTPSSGVLTNCTGLPVAGGGTGASTAVAGGDALHVKGADIASAGTTNIAGATGHFVHVTGTTTITAFGTAAAGVERIVRFAGSLTLTHNATSLILPGGANIVTQAGDVARLVSEGSGNWRCTVYTRGASIPWRSSDWHPYSSRLEDLDANVIQAGNPGIYGTDGGGTSALVSSAAAVDGDLLMVDSGSGTGFSWQDLTTLLNALHVPRVTWQENGNPVRTVGASSTTEETLVSRSIGGASNVDECWELRFWGDFIQNSGGNNTSRLRIKLGATTVFDKANAFSTHSGRRVLVGRIMVSQRGSTSLQRVTGEFFLSQPLNATSGFGDYGAFAFHGGVVGGDAAETLSSAKTLSVTHQWDVSNANSYLRIYKSELIYHP